MKISELTYRLSEIKDRFGDLECIYAIDDEGNAYHYVSYHPSLMYMDKNYVAHSKEDIKEMMHEDEDFCIDNYEPVCCVN